MRKMSPQITASFSVIRKWVPLLIIIMVITEIFSKKRVRNQDQFKKFNYNSLMCIFHIFSFLTADNGED